MYLNILDLGVCVLTAISQIFRVLRLVTMEMMYLTLENATESSYLIFTENTGFATTLLSVTRCLSVSLPMYRIKERYVAISAGIFFVYTTIREITLHLVYIFAKEHYSPKVHGTFPIGGIEFLVILVIAANFFSISKLVKDRNIFEQSRESTFKATVTIAILSALFCVFNTIYCIATTVHIYFSVDINKNFAIWFGAFFSVPINSAINPMIYFWRKQEMRTFLMNILNRCRCPRVAPQIQPHPR